MEKLVVATLPILHRGIPYEECVLQIEDHLPIYSFVDGHETVSDVLSLLPEQLNLEVIARTLHAQKRFSARDSKCISVLQHLYFCDYLAREHVRLPVSGPFYNSAVERLSVLGHDWGESFSGDVITPVKALYETYIPMRTELTPLEVVEHSIVEQIFRRYVGTKDGNAHRLAYPTLHFGAHVKPVDSLSVYYELLLRGLVPAAEWYWETVLSRLFVEKPTNALDIRITNRLADIVYMSTERLLCDYLSLVFELFTNYSIFAGPDYSISADSEPTTEE